MAVLAFQDFGDMLMELVSALESLDTSEIALVFAFSFLFSLVLLFIVVKLRINGCQPLTPHLGPTFAYGDLLQPLYQY